MTTDQSHVCHPPAARLSAALLLLVCCMGLQAQPTILITHLPAWGASGYLTGLVAGVDFDAFRVAAFLHTEGWWNKPTWGHPLTPILSNGIWSCNVNTGGGDISADAYAAFLVTNTYTPPLLAGATNFPDELYAAALATVITNRAPRQLMFAGALWTVKAADVPVGPGPNYFSANTNDVFVDDAGRLHLRVVYRDGAWRCTEVISAFVPDYGMYLMTVTGRVDLLDQNVTFGFFTWDTAAPQFHYREIDIEVSRWGQTVNSNAQFVVQPWDTPGNLYRYNMNLSADAVSTHGFIWGPAAVYYQSLHGRHAQIPGPGADQIATWTYAGADVPPAGGGEFRFNLWINTGTAPANGLPAEVIIESFRYNIPEPIGMAMLIIVFGLRQKFGRCIHHCW